MRLEKMKEYIKKNKKNHLCLKLIWFSTSITQGLHIFYLVCKIEENTDVVAISQSNLAY